MSRENSREVCVHIAGGETAGQQVKSFLLSRGIPSRFRGESLRKVHGFTLNGLGEVRIYVPAEFETQARELLASVASGDLELAEGELVEASTEAVQPLAVVPSEGDEESD